jgi:hypothetical protein
MNDMADIRSAIVARLASVPGIGVVHACERYSADLARLKALYVWHGAIRGWFVRRAQVTESGNRLAHTVETTRWHLRGFMALDDAAQSELIFDGVIESVRNAFAQDETLDGTVAQCSEPGNEDGLSGIALDEAGPVMFGGVLCHACRLSLLTARYLERQP